MKRDSSRLAAKAAIVAPFMALGLSAPAIAADITPAPVAPAPVIPAAAETFNWSGAYVGAFAGLTTGDFKFSGGETGEPEEYSEASASGFLGGAQLGYDWQFGSWVVGAVADIAATNHEARFSDEDGEDEARLKYLGTVRGRIGATFDRALFYGHGGFAYGKTELRENGATGSSTNQTGWTIGAGVEYALTDNLSLGTEYSYVDFGDKEVFRDSSSSVNQDLSFHTLKAAVNFRF